MPLVRLGLSECPRHSSRGSIRGLPSHSLPASRTPSRLHLAHSKRPMQVGHFYPLDCIFAYLPGEGSICRVYSSFLPVAVIKHSDQEQLRGYPSGHSSSLSSQDRNSHRCLKWKPWKNSDNWLTLWLTHRVMPTS